MITITIIFIIVITIVIIIYLIKQVTCKEAFTATQLPPFKVNHSTARDLHNQPRSQGSWNEVCTYSSLRTVLWVPSFAFHKNQNSERAVRRGLSHGFSPHPRRLPMYIRTKTFSAVGPVGIWFHDLPLSPARQSGAYLIELTRQRFLMHSDS